MLRMRESRTKESFAGSGSVHDGGRTLRPHAEAFPIAGSSRNEFRWLRLRGPTNCEKLTMCRINLSGQSLGDDKFRPYVIDQFHRRALDATPRSCSKSLRTAGDRELLAGESFRSSGAEEWAASFALDDFGPGLSSFGFLKHFPVRLLEIDGKLRQRILPRSHDRDDGCVSIT